MVAAIFWWPGRIPAASVAYDVATHMDLLPTIAHVAGVTAPPLNPLDGVDISPVLFKQAAGVREYFYYWRGQVG